MTITKADLVETISRQMAPSITKRDVGKIVQMFIDELCKTLQEGNRIEIRGFGVMSTKLRKPKVARNPKTTFRPGACRCSKHHGFSKPVS
jgi:integration host factor subunit beta